MSASLQSSTPYRNPYARESTAQDVNAVKAVEELLDTPVWRHKSALVGSLRFLTAAITTDRALDQVVAEYITDVAAADQVAFGLLLVRYGRKASLLCMTDHHDRLRVHALLTLSEQHSQYKRRKRTKNGIGNGVYKHGDGGSSTKMSFLYQLSQTIYWLRNALLGGMESVGTG